MSRHEPPSDPHGADAADITTAPHRERGQARGMLTSRRNLLLAMGGTAAAAALATGLDDDGTDGNLYAGNAALSEAYHVAGGLYIGPDSAKSTVDAKSGRYYLASDTEREYYGDGGSWQWKGLSVPSLDTDRTQYTGPKANRLKIGLFSDVHWNESGTAGNPDRQSKSTIKANLDTFIDDMNNDFGADIVIFGGDAPDYNASTSFSELKTWIQEFIDYMETSGGSAGSGLDMPIHYLLGNHEYGYAGDYSMSTVYDLYGWSGLSDTYRSVVKNGIRLLLLNDCYTTTSKSTTDDDHKIPDSSDPADEVQWIRDELDRAAQTSTPVLPFMHVGVTGGNRASYDQTENAATVEQDLNTSPLFRGGLFGHSHHDPAWDRVREQRDRFETPWVHCPTPHNLMGDTSVTPYTTLVVSPSGMASVSASYDTEKWQTGWPLTGHRSPSPMQLWSSSGIRLTYTGFDSIAGWQTDQSGTSASIAIDGTTGDLEFITGTSTGNTIYSLRNQKRASRDFDWSMPWGFRIAATAQSTGSEEFLTVAGNIAQGDKTKKHVGLRTNGGTLYATVADGTNESTVQLKSSTGVYEYKILYRPDLGRVDFLNMGNGEVEASITSTLPSGSVTSDRVISLLAHTGDGTSYELDVHEVDLVVGGDLLEVTAGEW